MNDQKPMSELISLVRKHGDYWIGILARAVKNCVDSKAYIHAAALAFFTMFSIAPVMIVAVTVTGLILGESAAEGQLLAQLSEMIGSDAAVFIETAVLNAQLDQGGWLPTIIGVAAIMVGATTVFAQMQQSLNVIWGVTARPSRSGLFILFKNRLLSLTLVLSIGFLLLTSLFLSVGVQAVLSFADQWLPMGSRAVIWLELGLSVAVIMLLFATIYRVLPEVRLRWSDVMLGGLVTAVLFVLGRYIMARYLANTAIGSMYGAAGSLVLFLLWVHYSSLVLLFGAAVARAHMQARGRVIRPKSTAVRMRRELLMDEH